jgi:predicted Zn-dependent peptidase
MEYRTHVLPNGIKLIHVQAFSPVAHCGFFINTGSRDELASEHGMAHFIEHLFFKGTKKRRSFHILSRLEDVGGELNAYTTKEETCLHASFLSQHCERAIELISDIVFNSTFPEKAISSERDVIIDEINSYKDSPSELIFDDFEDVFFRNHSLGRNILGTSRLLKKIKQRDILSFISRNYNTDQMVFASVGNISFLKLVYWFEKYFKDIPFNPRSVGRLPFTSYQSFNSVLRKGTFQIHTIIGNLGYSLQDPRRMALHLLCNILGGPGMISRLNLALRERNGYSYNIEANYTPYSDIGIFAVYFSTDKIFLDKCYDLVFKEFAVLRNKPLGSIQLKKAKQQIIGQLAIANESNENQMLSIGKSYLVYERIDTLEEIIAKIDSISASALMEVADDVLCRDQQSVLTYK